MENEILGQILTELKELNVRQNSMGEELMALQEFTMQKFERLEKRFDGLENEQKKTNLIIENEIRPSIQTLAEGQSQMQGQMERLENEQKKMSFSIENGIRPSIQVLEDGQVSMQMKLDRIEKRVTGHDEIVFRRVK